MLGLVILMFLLYIHFSSAVCTATNTPKIKPVNYFETGEGELFEYDFNLSNMAEDGVSYTYALFDEQLRGMSINNKGILRFQPDRYAVGVSRIAIIAAKENCADTLIITLRVFDRPDLVYYFPGDDSFGINQTDTVVFKVRADDTDANDSLTYEWLLNSKLINDSVNKTSISFKPGYRIAGVQEITARVTDSQNLSDTHSWFVQIAKTNKAPVFVYNLSSFILFKNTASEAYNLNDYFIDPDGGELRFEYKQIIPDYETSGVIYANISVSIDKTGYVTYNPSLNSTGYAYFVFTAYDLLNKSADSNTARVDLVGSERFKDLNQTSITDFCGDYVCSLVEDCNTCPFDCGLCEQEKPTGCKAEWNCTEWNPCLPARFQTRKCEDINDCGDNRTKPDEFKRCFYNATCHDSLKNGVEEGVDCGGPCPPCPNCSDNIKNRGEEGVDCGGPCPPCPSCADGIKNQNESDADCGGPCTKCAGGKECLKNLDCESLRCDRLVCTFANCNDTIRNQGEEGIDCSGPCPKACGNCSDRVQNAGEEGVDCGGKCKPCASCDDHIKNNGEQLIDCGGNCKKCTAADYIANYSTVFIILIIIAGFIPLFFVSYIFFLFANPDRARGLYENNTSFALIVAMNRFSAKWRKLRKKKPVISDEMAKTFISELTELSNKPDSNKMLHEEIAKIYTAILGLPEEHDQNIFNMKLRLSGLPMMLKILFAGYYKKSEILVISSFISAEEKADLVMELKFLLTEASKG